MATRSVGYVVVGALTLAYGLLLGLFWGWMVVVGGADDFVDVNAHPGPGLVLLSAPLVVLLAGGLLCWRRARLPTALVVAVTAALLGAKAVLAYHWGLNEMQGPDPSSLGGLVGTAAGAILMAVVAVPSMSWAVVLAATAAALLTGNDSAVPATRPLVRAVLRGAIIAGAIALAVAGQLRGLALMRASLPDIAGLEGTWRDPVNPKHSYHFGANGELESRWGGLSHGVVANWSRHGQQIQIRHTPDWLHVDDLDGTLEGGTIQWRRIDRASGKPADAVIWNREHPDAPK
jgi:hypothetical protein